ncbi:MAG: indolepyruvate oxidoreductase subunit beta [Spirochaetota bacterium]|nr:indolepyruvate oxidoreductase subunit beta [Spirochaetota bacterium]
MEKINNILLSGVGGQGTILAANILTHLICEKGFDIRKNEIHGMSQRGGDVCTHIRFGQKVYSPTIEKGNADYLVSFELLEGLRMYPFLKKGGICIINNTEIEPAPVTAGVEKYPEFDKIKKLFSDRTENFIIVDGTSQVKELNNPKGVNIFLLGVLSNHLDLCTVDKWLEAIKKLVKPDFIERNIKCFEAGRNA